MENVAVMHIGKANGQRLAVSISQRFFVGGGNSQAVMIQ